MPLAAYPDLGWFIRAVRIFPVVAIAACAGGAIGAFTVFTINGALTPPQRPDLRADGPSAAPPVPPKPIVGGATGDLSAKMPALQPPAPQAPVPPAAQPRPVRWPHALWANMALRAHKIAPPAQEPAATPALGEGEAQKNAEMDRKDSGDAAAPAEAARAAALRRAHAARKRERELSAAAAARQAGDRAYSGVYDYYGATTQSDAAGAPYGARRHAAVRGRRPGETGWRAPADAARAAPQQYWGGWNGGGFYRGSTQ